MPKPTFSLLHATRRLPDGWKDAHSAWLAQCSAPETVEYIFGIDQAQVGFYTLLLSEIPVGVWNWAGMFCDVKADPPSAAAAWNVACSYSTGDFIITIADDLFPPKHWDLEILKRIPDLKGEYVLWPDLSGDYSIMTFAFTTRPYLERLTREHGYQDRIWYPEYYGMRADNDFTACAKLDGVIVEARDLKFEHRHPTYKTAEWDETYRWQHRDEAFELGNRVFARRKAEGFKS
jgi:hypothetical protein